MAILTTGLDIGALLIRALGLPEHTRKVELIVEVNEIVVVRCEYYPDKVHMKDLLELKEYNLVALDNRWSVWQRPYLDACRGW